MNDLDNNELNIATKTKVGVFQTKNTEEIGTVDNGNVAKVLTASAKPSIQNITTADGGIKVDYTVEYDVLVVLDDASIVPLTQKNTFSQNYESNLIKSGSKVSVCPQVVELNNVSNDKIAYTTVINFDVYLTEQNTDIKNVVCDGDIIVKEETFSFNSLCGEVIYNGQVDFNISKDSKVNKILFTCSDANIKSVLPSNDYFVVTGELFSTIVFETEDGMIRSMVKSNTFNEEVECKGVNKESNIQAEIYVKESVVVENTEKSQFDFSVPIEIKAQIFNSNSANCVTDAYSLANEIKMTTISFEQSNFASTRLVEDNFVASSTIGENSKPIDRILAVVPSNISIVNQIVDDGILILEGISNINIIYYSLDDESNDELNSIDIDVPYSVKFNISDLKKDDEVFSKISFGDVSVKNKMGKELEILVEVKVNYNTVSTFNSAIVSQIDLGDEKPPQDYALEIYLSKKGQTLWDIAKELNISMEDLSQQNKDLSFPFENGEKIIAYRQRLK